ncbi:MAG: hypothetical protein AB9903_22500 [Vulcanimicrobiota bacterium]
MPSDRGILVYPHSHSRRAVRLLPTPRNFDMGLKATEGGVIVSSGMGPLFLILIPPLLLPLFIPVFLLVRLAVPEDYAMLASFLIILIILRCKEHILLRNDGTVRWTRYWGSVVELTHEDLLATKLKSNRFYLGTRQQRLLWLVSSDSQRWLIDNIRAIAHRDRHDRTVEPPEPSGEKSWMNPGTLPMIWFGTVMVIVMVGLPFIMVGLDSAEPSSPQGIQKPWLYSILLILGLTLLLTLWKTAAGAPSGNKPSSTLSSLGIGTLLNGISAALTVLIAGVLVFFLNVSYDHSLMSVEAPIIASFHLTGKGGNGYAQDLYFLELNVPESVSEKNILCYYTSYPTLKKGDTVTYIYGPGRLGIPWYRFPAALQGNYSETSEMGSQSFGHETLSGAAKAGRVFKAKGSFDRESRCLSQLEAWSVPVVDKSGTHEQENQ